MEYWLYSSHAYYDSFNEVIRVFYIIYDIIKKENPDEIVYIREDVLHDKIIKLISEEWKIRTRRINSFFKLMQFKMAKKIKMILIKNLFDIKFILRKIIFSFILNLKKGKGAEKIDGEILSIYRCTPRPDYTQPILKKLKETKRGIYALDIAEASDFLDLGVFLKKIKEGGLNHVLLEDYISKKDINYINRINKELKNLWKFLKKREEFRQLFELNGINIWSIIEPQFSCYFDVRLKNHLINFIGIDNVIESIKPKVVITPVETTEFDKGMFLACQKRKITSLAMQHGFFNDLRCIHEKNEISLKDIKPQYCPIPTITAVYGENDKNFLINKGNYPKNSIIVTGNARYDRLAEIKNKLDKEQICEKLNIDPNKKIVVLLTGIFPLVKDREMLIKMTSDAVKKIDNLQLIIKVHPEESVGIYEKLAKDNKLNALITKHDIVEVLYICDTLLTVSSTAGLEAAILDKPIISITSIEESNLVDYVQKGIAIGAYNDTELVKAIKEELYNKKIQNKLAENRKKYVNEHCYKIDGKAGERIVALVNYFIK